MVNDVIIAMIIASLTSLCHPVFPISFDWFESAPNRIFTPLKCYSIVV